MDSRKINNQRYLDIANKLRLARYAVFAALMVLLICSIAMLRDEITVENLRYLFKYVDVGAPEISGEHKQIYYRANSSSQFTMLRNDLAVLNNSGYNVYSFSGRKIMSDDIKYPNPAIETSGKYSLCYDIGGSELSVYNALSCLYENRFENGIFGADINESGAFAVITTQKNYVSGIEVFSKKFSSVFKWMSPNLHVLSVELSDNNKNVACACVYSQNGTYITALCVFDIRNGKQVIKYEIEDEFPYKVVYNNGVYVVITDKSVNYINAKGEQKAKYNYPRNSLVSYYIGDNYIVLSCINSVLGNENQVKIIDYNGTLLYNKSYEDEILSVCFDASNLYVLRKGNLDISTYVIKDNVIEVTANADISVSPDIVEVFCIDNAYYVLVSPSGAVKYSSQGFASGMPQK